MTSSPPALRGILKPAASFERNRRRLPPRIQAALVQAMEELLKGELSPGRNYEQLTNMPGVYSVRLGRSHRFVFDVTDGDLYPLAVGPHDHAYDDAVRRYRRSRS